ncbi:MAG: YdcF family protein [Ignavibacteriaceae bacterium]
MFNENKRWTSIIVIILLALDLIFLFFIKYENQDLSLTQFRFSNTGNILNLLFFVVSVITIIIYSFSRRIQYNGKLLIYFTSIITALLILASISTVINFPDTGIYIFNHPLHRILTGALFFIYQYLQIFFIIYLLLKILGTENLILTAAVDSVLLTIGLLMFAYLFSSLQQKDLNTINPEIKGNNVAVVLGAAVWSHNQPSPSLKARLNKAIELYEDSVVNYIQLTGSNAPGELSEARVAFNYLLKKGINPARIWIEEKTTSTSEQIHFIKNELIKKKKIKTIILISAPYHLTRAKEICKFYNIKVYTAASDIMMSTNGKIYNNVRESVALLAFWLFAL